MILLLPQIWLCISQRVTFRNPAQYLIYVPHSWKAIFNIEKLKYHCSAFNWAKYFRSFTSNLAEFRILKLLQENIMICLKHCEYFQIIPNNQCFCDIKTFLPIEAKPNFLPWKEDVIIFDSNFTNSLFFYSGFKITKHKINSLQTSNRRVNNWVTCLDLSLWCSIALLLVQRVTSAELK